MGVPARGYRWADAGPGNLLAEKSGFWIDPTLRAEHPVELEEIGAAVADQIGHGDSRITRQVYAHVYDRREGLAKVRAALAGVAEVSAKG